MLVGMERRLGEEHRQVTVPVRVGRGHLRGPSRNEVRGPRWRRTSRGFYVPAATRRTPEQRVVEAAVLCPDVAGVTGWAALRWMGAPWFDGTTDGGRRELPVTIATCYPDIRSQPGIVVCQERLRPSEVVEIGGLPVTSAARSVLFEMRYASSLAAAVVVADMAMFSDLVTTDELSEHALLLSGWTGIPQAREALGLACESSWSPMETRLRLLWEQQAGLPRPLANTPVFDLVGRHVATPDLLDVESGLAVEYDGALHLERPQRLTDLRRERRMRAVGLEIFSVVADDLSRPAHLAAQLRRSRRDAIRRRQGVPAWTVDPPAWWRRTQTVAQRRALAADSATA